MKKMQRYLQDGVPVDSVTQRLLDQYASRAGKHARSFLQDWKGKLVCDDLVATKPALNQG